MTRALLVGLAALAAGSAAAAEKEGQLIEIRVYYAAKGKLDALNARFRDHTCKLFEKHGMTNVGYFVPTDPADERLIYMIAHKDRAARDASFKAFGADPAWKTAAAESEKNGKLVDRIDYFFVRATDYSPPAAKGTGGVYELRTYLASPNNLGHLNARFREHTCKLFEGHGMTNIAYWALDPADKATAGKVLKALSPVGKEKSEVDEKAPAAPLALVYLISHKSEEAAKASWDGFRKDPKWVAARTASEQKAGGTLTAKDAVKSLFLKPTDYSPMK